MGDTAITRKSFTSIQKLPVITRCSSIYHGSCSAFKHELLPQRPLRYPVQYYNALAEDVTQETRYLHIASPN